MIATILLANGPIETNRISAPRKAIHQRPDHHLARVPEIEAMLVRLASRFLSSIAA